MTSRSYLNRTCARCSAHVTVETEGWQRVVDYVDKWTTSHDCPDVEDKAKTEVAMAPQQDADTLEPEFWFLVSVPTKGPYPSFKVDENYILTSRGWEVGLTRVGVRSDAIKFASMKNAQRMAPREKPRHETHMVVVAHLSDNEEQQLRFEKQPKGEPAQIGKTKTWGNHHEWFIGRLGLGRPACQSIKDVKVFMDGGYWSTTPTAAALYAARGFVNYADALKECERIGSGATPFMVDPESLMGQESVLVLEDVIARLLD